MDTREVLKATQFSFPVRQGRDRPSCAGVHGGAGGFMCLWGEAGFVDYLALAVAWLCPYV